jgi:23S rRNA pseudouridine1911/1915/1917 synthase
VTERFESFLATGGELRLDRLVADVTGRGRRAVRQLIRDGSVRIDGRIATGAETPRPGSEITIAVADVAHAPDLPVPAVVAETRDWLLLAKPAGLHCERGRSAGSVAEFLAGRDPSATQIGDRPEEAGLAHRLDRDTSGAILAARNRSSYGRLREAFAAGRTRKEYLALVAGDLSAARRIDLPLARRGDRMTPAGPREDAFAAATAVEPLERGDGWTLVLALMRSGAMHQVRVHLAAIGLPLIGDALYGGPELAGCSRAGQLLHASRIVIRGGIEIDAAVAAPADFVAALALLRTRWPAPAKALSACVSPERT